MTAKPSILQDLSLDDLSVVTKLEQYINIYLETRCGGQKQATIHVKRDLTSYYEPDNREEIMHLCVKINDNVANEIIRRFEKAGWKKVDYDFTVPEDSCFRDSHWDKIFTFKA
jgi:hypothetical protein